MKAKQINLIHELTAGASDHALDALSDRIEALIAADRAAALAGNGAATKQGRNIRLRPCDFYLG